MCCIIYIKNDFFKLRVYKKSFVKAAMKNKQATRGVNLHSNKKLILLT
jgi:hypothetical protein